MSLAQAGIQLTFPQSPFPPLAVGFMGLGTGYLVYGTQELFGYPPRDERVDLACVYVAEFFATLAPDVPAFRPAEKAASSTSAPGCGCCTWCSRSR